MTTAQAGAVARPLWAARPMAALILSSLSLALTACGGGGGRPGTSVFGDAAYANNNGGSGGGGAVSPSVPSQPDTEVLAASTTLAQRCAPDNPLAEAGKKNGSLSLEKQWIRSYVDEAYLWREQVPRVNAALYTGPSVEQALDDYFHALRTPERTASGALRDRFSFTFPSAEWQALAQGGVEQGYGLEWSQASKTPPRGLRIAYVEPGGPAAKAGLQRGDRLVMVDGVNADAVDQGGIDVLNAALYPTAGGRGHSFLFSRAGGMEVSAYLSSAAVAKQPVLLSQVLTAADGRRVGHLVFNDHIAPAEAQLIDAVREFKQQGIADLMLDLRYNGGGYLYIASELAYMIAGPQRSQDKVFEQLRYNSRRSADNQSPSARTPFFTESCLYDGKVCTLEQPLPTLNLARVYVLTQAGTCSASESIINGLRGIGVEVIQIGGRSCGKPYGFTAKDNCGMSYFPIEFVGNNAAGFGDYADGFEPGGSGPAGLPGCRVADDLSRPLGDSREAMLAAALAHRIDGRCPPESTSSSKPLAAPGEAGLAWALKRSPLRENRFLGGR